MNACEYPTLSRTHTFTRVGITQGELSDRAVVRVIKRAMVMVLQMRQPVTGVALLADLAYRHLCEGGSSGPIRHEGGADSPEFYRLSCQALSDLQRDGFVARERSGDHDFISLARRSAVQVVLPSSPSIEPVSASATLAKSSPPLGHPARFRMSLSGAAAATFSITAISVAVTGCMTAGVYDQPRYSYFLPTRSNTETHADAPNGPAGDAAVPLRLLSLNKATTANAPIEVPEAMPVAARDRSMVASALSVEIASDLKKAMPASVPQSLQPAASTVEAEASKTSGTVELKTDTRFESVKRIVSFGYASAQLNPDARQQLQLIVPLALQAASVKVTGATDASGDGATNKRLALNRAVAVARSLIASGVATSHVRATYCTTCFIGRNDSDEGRRSNRRVDVEMVMPVNFKGLASSSESSPKAAAKR